MLPYTNGYLGLKRHLCVCVCVCVCVCMFVYANIQVFNDASRYIPVLDSPKLFLRMCLYCFLPSFLSLPPKMPIYVQLCTQCVCVCACVRAWMHECVVVCAYAGGFVCVRVCDSVCLHTYVIVHACCVHVCVSVGVCLLRHFPPKAL